MHESLVNNMTPTVERLLDTLYENHGFDLVAEAEEIESKRVADLILEGADAIDQDETQYVEQAEQISACLEDIVWNDFMSKITLELKTGFEQILQFNPTAQLALSSKGRMKLIKNIVTDSSNLQNESMNELHDACSNNNWNVLIFRLSTEQIEIFKQLVVKYPMATMTPYEDGAIKLVKDVIKYWCRENDIRPESVLKELYKN
jgi:hypothetical protein